MISFDSQSRLECSLACIVSKFLLFYQRNSLPQDFSALIYFILLHNKCIHVYIQTYRYIAKLT